MIATPARPVASWACGASPVPRVSFQEGTPGRFPCKQQRIYKALPRIGSPTRHGRVVFRMEWAARGGPSASGFHIGRKRPRHAAPRDANARRGAHRAQFQLWIFSYQTLRRLANLMLSRLFLTCIFLVTPDRGCHPRAPSSFARQLRATNPVPVQHLVVVHCDGHLDELACEREGALVARDRRSAITSDIEAGP